MCTQRSLRLLLPALAVGALVACGDGERVADRSPAPPAVTSDAMRLGPGTPIGDELVVPEHSELVTWPTPALIEPGPGGWAWSAALSVSDPVAVFNDLAAQAAAAGFEMHTTAGPPCRDTGSEVVESDLVDEAIWCNASGLRTTEAGTEQIDLHTSLVTGRPPDAGGRGAVAVRRLAPAETVPLLGADQWEPEPLEPGTSALRLDPPEPAPDGLELGEALGDSPSSLSLVPGSRLAPNAAVGWCQDGVTAHLDVTGDPDTVFDAYVEQVAEWAAFGSFSPEQAAGELFGRRTREVRAAVDGSSLGASMVVGSYGEPTRLTYSGCSG